MIYFTQKKAFWVGLVCLAAMVASFVYFVGSNINQDDGASAAQNVWIHQGYNEYGTHCNNTISVETTPRPYPSLSTASHISGGEGFSLVARADGTVLAAGNNDKGQLGLGTFTTQENATQIPGLVGIDKVYAGDNFGFAMDTSTGTVWGWGDNSYGQLGLSSTLDQSSPVEIFNSGVIDIAPGRDFTLFLRSDNTVLASGNNFFGQLGDGTNTAKIFPVSTGLTNIVEVSAGDYFGTALDTNGNVYTWGFGGHGQLGNGGFANTNSPSQVLAFANVAHVLAGSNHVITIKNDDTLWEWGYTGALSRNTNPENPALVSGLPGTSTYTALTRDRIGVARNNTLVSDDGGNITIWGYNLHGQSADGNWAQSINPQNISFAPGASVVAQTKGDFVQLIRANSTASGWGFNHFHNLGYANTFRGDEEFTISSSQNFSDVAGGKSHVLFLRNDGTVLSCGLGFDGQLGLGNSNTVLIPTSVPGLTGITDVVGSDYGSFALSATGNVYEWGATPANVNTPQQIAGLNNIVAITASHENLFALDATADLYVYGNSGDEAGLNGVVPTSPQLVASNVSSVACSLHSCGYVDINGNVFTTGYNYHGQLGNGTTGNVLQNTFVQVASLSSVESIYSNTRSAGYAAQSYLGDVYVWGEEGLLGDDSTNPDPTPAVLPIEDVSSIGFLFDKVYAKRTDGGLWSWDRNPPEEQYYIEKVLNLPKALPNSTAYLKGDLLEPITNIVSLNVLCQVSVTSSSTTCRFEVPAGERVPDNFALQIGGASPSGPCVTAGNIAFCENVPTGSVSGLLDVFAVVDGNAPVDTGEDVQIDELDTDGDGMPDSWENLFALDAGDPSDVSGDPDNDQLNNINEYLEQTDPQQGDTDFDLVSDGDEVNILATDPLVQDSDSSLTTANEAGNTVSDGAEDFDGDGFNNMDEISGGSNPFDPNSRPASVLIDGDIPAMVFYCTSGQSSEDTTCEFNLPLDKLMPASFSMGVGSPASLGGVCTLNNTTRLVSCLNVPVGSASGSQNIVVQIGVGPVIDTGEDVVVDMLDSDSDGLPDSWETTHGLDPNNSNGGDGPLGDGDQDGLTNLEEYFYGTNPTLGDTDNDDLSDRQEVGEFKTDPLNADSDSAFTATDEANNSVSDGAEDFDGDGYSNIEEANNNSNPFDPVSVPATDITSIDISSMVWFCDEALVNSTTNCRSTIPAGKKLSNTLNVTIGSANSSPACAINNSSIECNAVPTGSSSGLQTIFVQIGSNPAINTGERVRINGSVQSDSDNDGLPDSWENQFGLDSNNAVGNDGATGDGDNDGLTNIQEYNNGTNPTVSDTDNDGVNDGQELLILSTDPTNQDSNSLRSPVNNAGNGVNDGQEDFDNDGFTNSDEISAGTDPFNPNSKPGTTFDSLDIQELTVYCQEGIINSVTACTFTLPQNKFLPVDFKLGVSNAVPGGSCVTSGSTVSCSDVPTGSFEGSQFIYGQIGSNQSVSTGERVRISAIVLTDSDGDGLPDSWEIEFDLDERNAEGFNGRDGDPDDDGFTNIQEYNFDTDPLRADTDGDGVNDKDESEILLTDPTNSDSDSGRTENVDESNNNISDGDEDFDGDGYTNRQELFAQTSSFNSEENPLTGPSGEPIPQDSEADSNSSTIENVVPNLNNTDRTGGLAIISLIGSSVLSVVILGVWLLMQRRKLQYRTKK